MIALVLGALLGCSTAFTNDTGTDPDSPGGGGDLDDLPNLTSNLDTGGCDSVNDSELAGATAYFYGGFAESGAGLYEGEERVLLYANPTWSTEGGADCEAVWSVSAEEVDVVSCGGCDLGLQIDATLDPGLTTCDTQIVAGEETFSVRYDVDTADDGTATFYFANSGDFLGQGFHEDGAYNYLSDKTCWWF